MKDDKDSYENSFFKNIGKKKADIIETNVINDELIKKYISEYNSENKIFGMNDMPFSKLIELRLSFQNILKIQNLRGLERLKKLWLDNNLIPKIENLTEELGELEWLDLSFNKISVVEGLDELINLTDLSLFHNEIKVVDSGLDNCKRLNLLSLGDNQIAEKEPTIGYLRRFQNLQVLKLEGNPLANDSDYKSFVMAHVSQLKYLDYILIDQQEVLKARDEHREELQQRESTAPAPEEIEKELADQKRISELSDAFLVKTNGILEQLVQEYDEEEKRIRVLPEQGDKWEVFYEKFKDGLAKFQRKIIEMNKHRLEKIDNFKNSVKNAEDENEKEDIKNISQYEKIEKQALRKFEIEDYDDDSIRELKDTLEPKIDDLENVLIDKELQLVERINEAIDHFEKKLKSIVDGIKDECKNFQEEMNKEVEVYFNEIEKIKDEQIKAFNAENVNLDNFTAEQRDVYTDRDGLNNAISTLAEEYKNMVFSIEEDTNKAYDEELESFTSEFKNEKHERNRIHIREIMELVEDKRKKIAAAIAGDGP